MKRFFPSACMAVVISLLLNAIWLTPVSAATVPQLTWLGELRGGELASPRAIDVDGQGNLYVADQLARAVLKFDRYGQYVSSFLEGKASGKGVAVTPDGRTLYVSTKSQGVAIVNLADGSVAGYLDGANLVGPGEIDLDRDGYIFVADAGAGQFNIKIFFPNGTFKSVFAGAGKTAGKFTNIAALAVNPLAGRVYVANGEAAVPRLQVFDTAGALQSSVPNSTLYGADNHSARGIAFEERADGRAYVLRYLPAALLVFDGSFTTSLGNFGNLSGKLTAPVDTVYDLSTNRLYISDGSGIDVFGIDGATSPVRKNSPPTTPVSVSPVAGTAVASVTPALNWSAATDADGDALTYQVVVKQGAATVYATTTAATSVAVPTGLLAENGAYSWTVQANDGLVSSPVGAAAPFVVNTLNEAPAAPAAVAPLSGEKLGDDGVLAWTAASDPDPNDILLAYRLEIATDGSFVKPLLAETFGGTSAALTELAGYADLVAGTGYFWRVTALDAAGAASAPSATGSFVYDVMQLKVSANVADASVYLHGNHAFAGQFVGVTPLELRNLPAGQFSVVVERSGFDPYVAQVTLAEGTSATLSASLLPARNQATFKLGTINATAGIAVGGNAVPFLVDFDNDGRLDLLAGDATGQLAIFLGQDMPSADKLTVEPRRSLGLAVLPGAAPFVADWDNDGRKDLLVGLTDGTVSLFTNTGNEAAPAFAAAQSLTVEGGVLSVGAGASPAVVDLDGDGAKDLVVGNAAGQVVVFYNQSRDDAPQLAAGVVLFQVAGAAQITPVDWDADGDRDLLVTVAGVPAFYRNDLATAKAFTAAGKLPVSGAYGVAVADIDGGNGKDLLIGQADGKLLFQASTAELYAVTAMTYLLAQWDEIALLVAGDNPAALPQANKVRTELVANNYADAGKSALTLAGMLAAGGEARPAVVAFAALLK